MAEVKLIATTQSLFCARVEWALKLKGVEYEYLEDDLRNKSPLLLKYNPVHKKVPVLVHDGKPIAESYVILEYIDETWKQNPLLAQDPYERAMARFWARFVDDKCVLGAWQAACLAEGEEKIKAIESAQESLAFLEKQIEGKKYFGGEEIGFLDLAAGWIPLWLNVMEEVGGMKLLDAERFPFLHEWARNFMEIPLIRESIPPRDKLLDYFHASISYMRSLATNIQ
uniref:glutathione transferase n=1 Tax=Betula platyphylla TaxID=78630 RepID=A0A7D7PVS2_BETPL|nr:glutathione S-transferase [Betula platyphylla]